MYAVENIISSQGETEIVHINLRAIESYQYLHNQEVASGVFMSYTVLGFPSGRIVRVPGEATEILRRLRVQ